ncbi:MAG: hypothetical protein H6581_27960 [Bacteroidia bacterium]|nr:hypothetical protein [Bacteroidia bacterium]
MSKTLGPGNFLVSHLQVDQDEDWDEEEDFFDDEEEDFEMDFSHPDPFQWTSDDWAIFLEDEEVLPFPVYARAIDCLYRLSDKEATVNTDGWEEEYKKFVPANFEISGIVDPEDEDEYVESINLFASVAGAGKNLLKKIKKLFHNHPENEILREIILEFLLTEFDAKDAGPLAREFFQSFPESIGAKTKMAEFLIRVGDLDGAMEIMGGSFSLVKLFPGQQKFTGMELMHVLDLAIFYYVTKFEISKATMYSEWEWNLFAGNGVNLSGLRAITDFKESQMPDLRVIIEGLESEGKIR